MGTQAQEELEAVLKGLREPVMVCYTGPGAWLLYGAAAAVCVAASWVNRSESHQVDRLVERDGDGFAYVAQRAQAAYDGKGGTRTR